MNRLKYINRLKAKGLSDERIASKLKLSTVRVQQIRTGYINPSKYVKPEDLKIWTARKRRLYPKEWKEFVEKQKAKISPKNHKIFTSEKRKLLNLPTGRVDYGSGGLAYIRELVRMRDDHTCQICKKVWSSKMRRFDVHHLDIEQEGKKDINYDRNNMDKMITLCHKCHIGLHTVREKISNGLKRNNLTKA